jgi:hypothetical protein
MIGRFFTVGYNNNIGLMHRFSDLRGPINANLICSGPRKFFCLNPSAQPNLRRSKLPRKLPRKFPPKHSQLSSQRPYRLSLPHDFEFLLIESIPTNLLLRGHSIRRRCGSKAGPDVRAFRERTGHRSLSCNLESCLALCTGPPYGSMSAKSFAGREIKNHPDSE